MSQRRVVITGGFGILGQAVAEHFRSLGDRVALIDAAVTATPDLQERLGAHVVLAGVDLTESRATEAAFERIGTELGGIDCLINIAGGFVWETLLEGTTETWDRMYALNLRTAVGASKAALPLLLASASGRIVNVGAAATAKASGGMGAYTAAKSGVARLTEALAEELKDRGITVNVILPSIIDTPANRRDMPQADFTRWVRPESLATIIGFLCSDDASAITGASIPVTHRC
jgi:NAD(P)-dependent dehydrogenase (short-subunit alcohol dehydrogenase family)